MSLSDTGSAAPQTEQLVYVPPLQPQQVLVSDVLRKRLKHCNKAHLARSLMLDYSYIWMLFTGRRRPSSVVVRGLAQYFRVSADEMLAWLEEQQALPDQKKYLRKK